MASYLTNLTVIFLILTIARGGKNDLQCKDDNGNIVDWYVLYKVPKISQTSYPAIRKGISYLYITNDTLSKGWQLSRRNISDKNSIPGRTLTSLYKDTAAAKLLWVLYNDQAPNKNYSGKYGHSKGVVMADDSHGFWLVHSVPHYPPVPRSGVNARRRSANNTHSTVNNPSGSGEYSYPKSGMQYGQSFLCISFNKTQMNLIGQQLMYNQAIPYRSNLPAALTTNYPSLVDAINQVRVKKAPFIHQAELISTAGQKFISFAKSDRWLKDLYDDFVGPKLQSDLFAETWLNGRGKLPSECNGTRVLNVQSILLNVVNVGFQSSRDHSKWAVSTNNRKNRSWVCVGDINRAMTQFTRGGGTVCINNSQLWNNYRESVNDIEQCTRRN